MTKFLIFVLHEFGLNTIVQILGYRMIFLQVYFSTIITLLFSINVISIDLKLKNLQEIAKNIIADTMNKTRGISQVGPKPGAYLDYPGLDNEKLNTNMRLWSLYYKCLEELLTNINKNNVFQAKVITSFRSSSLR